MLTKDEVTLEEVLELVAEGDAEGTLHIVTVKGSVELVIGNVGIVRSGVDRWVHGGTVRDNVAYVYGDVLSYVAKDQLGGIEDGR